MKSYLITVITVSICIGIYNIISPSLGGIEKYSKMIGMLIVLCVIISPVKDLLDMLDENGLDSIKDSIIDSDNSTKSEYGEIFNEYLTSFSIEEIKRGIKELLLKEFDIPDNDCEIRILSDQKDGNMMLSRVQILLSGKSIFKNPYVIEEYFEKLLKCTCEVLIK